MIFFNIRNQIKLLIKIKVNNDMELEVSKVSSALSQYGIEEANLIDFYINNFFKDILNVKKINLNSFFINKELFLPLQLIIFRDDLETFIKIFFFDKKFLIKNMLDNKLLFTEFNIFLINSLGQKNNFYSSFFKNLSSYKGFFFSFKNRDFLKARKINFRRKIKENSYND